MSHRSPAASRCTSPIAATTEPLLVDEPRRPPSPAADWEVLDADQAPMPAEGVKADIGTTPLQLASMQQKGPKLEELHEGWDDEDMWDTQDRPSV